MFTNKKRRLEETDQKKQIKNVITYDKIRQEFLVEWDDLSRTWESSIPKEVYIEYRERISSYIS
jgi:hypothetical protein